MREVYLVGRAHTVALPENAVSTTMTAFFDKWQRAEGRFHPTRTRHDEVPAIKPDTPGRQAADEAVEASLFRQVGGLIDVALKYIGRLNPIFDAVQTGRERGRVGQIGIGICAGHARLDAQRRAGAHNSEAGGTVIVTPGDCVA